MATLARADIAAAMSLILQDKLVDQFRRDMVLPHLVSVKRGKNAALYWNPKFSARTAGGAYAEGADMADGDYDSHTRAQASLTWAEYRAGAKVSGLAMAVAADGLVTDVQATGDLFDEELIDATDKVAMDVAGDMYAGDPTASPVELAGAAIAVDSAAGTFAGLASSTYGDWLGNEASIAASALSLDLIKEHLIRPVKDATGRDPSFIVCPGDVWDDVEALFEERAEVITEVRTPGGMFNLQSVGARAIVVRGVPVIEDRHCTASTLYSITADDLEIHQLPSRAPGRSPANVVAAIKALTGVELTVEEVVQRMRRDGVIVPTIEFLAQTGDAYKAMVKVYLQNKWKRRNSHAKLVLT